MYLRLVRARNVGARFSVVAILAGLLASVFIATPAAQAAAACRADPVVVLSNGYALDLHATIGTSLSNITSITYALHGPALTGVGTSSLRLVPIGAITVGSGWVLALYPPDGTSGISHFTYNGDISSQSFYATVTVTIRGSAVPVTAYMDVVTPSFKLFVSAQQTGSSGQSILIPWVSA